MLKQRPYSVIFFLLLVLMLGAWSLFKLPYTVLPKLSYPSLIVTFKYNETNAIQIEKDFFEQAEEKVNEIKEVEHIKTEIGNQSALMEVEFAWGVDVNLMYIKLKETIDQLAVTNKMETSVLPNKRGFNPLFSIYIFDKTNDKLTIPFFDFIHESVYRKLVSVTGVQFIDGYGIREPYYYISPNLDALVKHGITQQVLRKQLENRIASTVNGSLIVNEKEYQIVIHKDKTDYITTNNYLAKVPLNSLLKIKELLSTDSYVTLNNKEAVRFDVYSKSTTDSKNLKQKIDAKLSALLTGTNYDWVVKDNTIIVINQLTSSISKSIFWGLIAVSILIFLVYRNFNDAFVILSIIPISYSLVFICLYLFQISLSIILLSSLLLSSGIIIDNTIIIIDELKKYTPDLKSTFGALIGSTVTNVSIFIPIIFLGGFERELFKDLLFGYTICGFTALFSSILFTTSIYYFLTKSQVVENTHTVQIHFGLMKLVFFLFRQFKTTLAILCLILFFSFFMAKSISFNFFDHSVSTSFYLKIKPPEYLKNESLNIILKILQKKISYDTFQDYSIAYGKALISDELNEKELNSRIISLKAKLKNDNPNQSASLLNSIIENLEKDDWKAEIINDKNLLETFLYPVQESYLAHLLSPSRVKVEQIKQVQENLNVSQLIYPLKEIVQAIPKKSDSLGNLIDLKVSNSFSSDYQPLYFNWTNMGRERKAVFSIDTHKSSLVNQWILIDSLFYRFQDIYETHRKVMYSKINRINGIPVTTFSISTQNDTLFEHDNKQLITSVTNSQNAFSDIQFSGRFLKGKEFKNLFIFLISSSFLIMLFVLLIQFENFYYAIVVLSTIPWSWFGGLIALFLFSGQITLYGLMGMLVVTGLSVNDTILKLSKYKQELMKYSAVKATYIASRERFKPIVLTSLTTIFALIPSVFFQNSINNPWIETSWAIIGGIVFSTLYSLLILPIILILLKKK